jgi:hypothetical protein
VPAPEETRERNVNIPGLPLERKRIVNVAADMINAFAATTGSESIIAP